VQLGGLLSLDRRRLLRGPLLQGKVEAADDRIGIVDGDGPDISQGLNLGSTGETLSASMIVELTLIGCTYTSLT
jgi:hypothetical protein